MRAVPSMNVAQAERAQNSQPFSLKDTICSVLSGPVEGSTSSPFVSGAAFAIGTSNGPFFELSGPKQGRSAVG